MVHTGQENNEPLYAYAQFLGESTECVLNVLLAKRQGFCVVAG
jgi:hypothetical protein